MATSTNPGSPPNDPRGNDQGQKDNNTGNAFAAKTESSLFNLNEQEDTGVKPPGEITASTRFGDEIEGARDEMERINRESEKRREEREHPAKPNMHPPAPVVQKEDNSMWD